MPFCVKCGDEFEPGHVGYANKCFDCSFNRKPTEEQQRKWDQYRNSFVNCDGERIYFEVVRRIA